MPLSDLAGVMDGLRTWMTAGMTLSDLTALIGALSALVIAITGALTALKVLREVKVGNDKTDAVEKQLRSVRRTTAKTQLDLTTTLNMAKLEDPKEGESSAVREETERQ